MDVYLLGLNFNLNDDSFKTVYIPQSVFFFNKVEAVFSAGVLLKHLADQLEGRDERSVLILPRLNLSTGPFTISEAQNQEIG